MEKGAAKDIGYQNYIAILLAWTPLWHLKHGILNDKIGLHFGGHTHFYI